MFSSTTEAKRHRGTRHFKAILRPRTYSRWGTKTRHHSDTRHFKASYIFTMGHKKPQKGPPTIRLCFGRFATEKCELLSRSTFSIPSFSFCLNLFPIGNRNSSWSVKKGRGHGKTEMQDLILTFWRCGRLHPRQIGQNADGCTVVLLFFFVF